MNWKVRIKNPVWWVQVVGAVLMTALAYGNMEPIELTSWSALWDVLRGIASNPYLLGSCVWAVWAACNDPTTAGLGDSQRAMGYDVPGRDL